MVGRHRLHTGLKTRCRANCKQRGAGSDSSLFAICNGDRGTAKREVPCFPFHHKRHGPRIGSGGRPQAWPHVMLSEQTRRHFHSCRVIVGKEETSPLIQCPNCSHTTTGRMLQAGTLSCIKSPDLLSKLGQLLQKHWRKNAGPPARFLFRLLLPAVCHFHPSRSWKKYRRESPFSR